MPSRLSRVKQRAMVRNAARMLRGYTCATCAFWSASTSDFVPQHGVCYARAGRYSVRRDYFCESYTRHRQATDEDD